MAMSPGATEGVQPRAARFSLLGAKLALCSSDSLLERGSSKCKVKNSTSSG